MKKNRKLMMALAIVAALIVGFFIGLFIEYPNVNNDELSGTIGRVSNYRNAKATEADIELRNDLLTDTIMQKSVSNYMGFYYAKSLEFAKTSAFAVEQAKTDEAFAAQNATQIEALGKYVTFLQTSRKDLLMATLVCQSVEESTPEMLRNAITQANNIIAQMNHRNATVISFIESLDAYILKTGRAANENLNRAHDLLVFNQIGSSLATRDKVMMKYFDKKQLFAKDIQTTPTDVKGSMIKDLETLHAINAAADMEKLMCDKETLGFGNSFGNGLLDIEKLGGFYDSEKLGLHDTEKLGFLDTEKLGFLDTEKLAGIAAFDSEQLGIIM